MIAERVVLHGVVRGGVVVPEETFDLPEGARVEITLAALPPDDAQGELAAETAAWERASDNAWALIEGWEKEPGEAAQK